MKHLVPPHVAQLSRYHASTGPRPQVQLSANESPWGTPAFELMSERTVNLNRYPDAGACELKDALASYLDVKAEQLSVGVGSDEMICLLLTAFGGVLNTTHPPRVVVPDPTFVMYGKSAQARGWDVVHLPLTPAWDLDLSAWREALSAAPNLVFWASPNNPTGNRFSQDAMRTLMAEHLETLFIIDEAYGAYAETSLLPWLQHFPNLALLGTLSKVGYAALRVGWLAARPELIDVVEKVRQPYNLPALSQALAAAVLHAPAQHIAPGVERVKAERLRLIEQLSRFGTCTESEANFVWVDFGQDAARVRDHLTGSGVAVRAFPADRLKHHLRITVGTPEENDILLAALRHSGRS